MSANPEDVKAQLTDNLKELHLPTMRGSFEELARRAQQESQSYERYLLELAERECQERREHRIERLLRESRLPLEKTWQALDLKRLPAKVVQQVRALLDGTFVDRRENVLAFGKPGSWKDARFVGDRTGTGAFGAEGLFPEVRPAGAGPAGGQAGPEAEPAVSSSCARYEVLVLDDLGYVQQSREEMEVLFTLLAERYERGSVMLTSNLAFSGWEAIFKDPMTTAAAIDRLVHHSVILELNVPSYRAEQAKKGRQEPGRGRITTG